MPQETEAPPNLTLTSVSVLCNIGECNLESHSASIRSSAVPSMERSLGTVPDIRYEDTLQQSAVPCHSKRSEPDPLLSSSEFQDSVNNESPVEDSSKRLVDATLEAVDWDILVATALRVRRSGTSIDLGTTHTGEFNAVRVLKFNDGVIWVARVPKLSNAKYPREEDEQRKVEEQILVGVASRCYVRSHTDIPVPDVFYWTTDKDGDGVGLPFMLESFLPGVPLERLWDDLSDDARSAFYKQVAHVYMELSYKCRLPKIGSPYMIACRSSDDGTPTDQEFTIGKLFVRRTANDDGLVTVEPYNSAMLFLRDRATTCLERIRTELFGEKNNPTTYSVRWILRSLLPHLYSAKHAAMDAKGFGLISDGFDLPNILVEIDPMGTPVITGILGWDTARTLPNTQFAKFPGFLMDMPEWDLDDPRRERAWDTQDVFIAHLRVEEEKIDPLTPLANAMDGSRLATFVDRALHNVLPDTNEAIWELAYGDDGSDVARGMIPGLQKGLLAKNTTEFEKDNEQLNTLQAKCPEVQERVQRPLTAREWLAEVKDKPELAEEQNYLEGVLRS